MYADDIKIKDALQLYFSQYHFKDGGYNDKYFKIKAGPFYIPFPNVKSRVAAVKLHDIHHLITEYKATMKGEVEIGGWEIGSGCGKYYVAWFLNSGSFLYGMFVYPRSLFRAFMRGRRCFTNFYYNTDYNETLLNKTIGELRQQTGIDSISKNVFSDYFLFFFFSLVCLLPAIVCIFILCAIFGI